MVYESASVCSYICNRIILVYPVQLQQTTVRILRRLPSCYVVLFLLLFSFFGLLIFRFFFCLTFTWKSESACRNGIHGLHGTEGICTYTILIWKTLSSNKRTWKLSITKNIMLCIWVCVYESVLRQMEKLKRNQIRRIQLGSSFNELPSVDIYFYVLRVNEVLETKPFPSIIWKLHTFRCVLMYNVENIHIIQLRRVEAQSNLALSLLFPFFVLFCIQSTQRRPVQQYDTFRRNRKPNKSVRHFTWTHSAVNFSTRRTIVREKSIYLMINIIKKINEKYCNYIEFSIWFITCE